MHHTVEIPGNHGPLYPVPLSGSRLYEFDRKTDHYHFTHFTEANNPELALAVQQLQGESYLEAGYVTPDDLDEFGRLAPHLDQARGDHVQYVAAESNGDVVGAVRLIHVPEHGDLSDLPAYRKSAHAIDPDFKKLLHWEAVNGHRGGLVEVSALSRKNNVSPTVLLEVIREIVQQVIRTESREVWFVTATDNSYNMIRSRFGDRAIIPIGEPVPVFDKNDTVKEIGLQPSVIVPGKLLESIANSALDSNTDLLQKKRLIKSLAFMTDGLNVNSSEVPGNARKLLGYADEVAV